MIFYIFICILHHLRVYYELTIWPAPSWLDSSVGRALYRYYRLRSLVQIPFKPGICCTLYNVYTPVCNQTPRTDFKRNISFEYMYMYNVYICINNYYLPKWRRIVVDIYQAVKFSICHTSWITSSPKRNFICDNIPAKAILLFFRCSEVNSTWLITSQLANQCTRKVLFTCVVYTNTIYCLLLELFSRLRFMHCTLFLKFFICLF